MRAFRRASIHFRNKGLTSRTGLICCGKTEIARCCLETYNAGIIEPQAKIYYGLLSCAGFCNTSSTFPKSHREICTFLSQAGAKSTEEDDDILEHGFSELEAPQDAAQDATSGDENDDDLSSRSELSKDEVVADTLNELAAHVAETVVGGKKSPRTRASSAMTKAILAAPASPVGMVLDKWVEEGNEATQREVSLTMLDLRKRRLFVKALQLLEWLESTKHIEFVERHYASRVDLIAKVRGLHEAENYLKQLPDSFRTEMVYRTLLANCVSATDMKKSEELFSKMKDLGFPTTCFSCNQLLILYKRTVKKKIVDVLLLMEKENIKPSLSTYQILIDVKGQANDITGMEQIVETMKVEGLEPSTQIQAALARYYAAGGLKDKAEAVLKEMEGSDIKNNRWVCRFLIPIYASLGRDDEVGRIWKVCESDPQFDECLAAIEAWGQLNRIGNAEVVFDKMLKKMKKPPSKLFTSLLKVYANHKMLAKGKDLARQMEESGCTMGPLTWDALVKLCVAAGKPEKADSILEKAIKQKRGKPLFSSYITILDKYAERGDVHNAEKVFQMMKEAGYTSRVGPYKSLLNAYLNAKTPAYGFSDRMKAANVIPNKALASQLARMDGFSQSAVAELLE